jgi:8-oxo-dGTP pyrophosphatase MutT (NUDIX family)
MDLWTICEMGHVHWGNAGGAGFLFRHAPVGREPVFLLQRRSTTVDYPGTWGIPGGATRDGESPEATAKREFMEEIGPLPSYRIRRVNVQDCGGNWKFHIILADVEEPFLAFCGKETDATGWFTESEMSDLRLHPGVQIWLNEQHPVT